MSRVPLSQSYLTRYQVEMPEMSSKSLLLVEDNVTNQRIAVEKVKNSKPGDYDLILMDIQMPIMDGYEATRQIRAIDDMQLSNITIIAMTANAFEEDKVAAIDAGMNDHLSKPVDVKMLKSVLARYLK